MAGWPHNKVQTISISNLVYNLSKICYMYVCRVRGGEEKQILGILVVHINLVNNIISKQIYATPHIIRPDLIYNALAVLQIAEIRNQDRCI
jgi:hypothetical protein